MLEKHLVRVDKAGEIRLRQGNTFGERKGDLAAAPVVVHSWIAEATPVGLPQGLSGFRDLLFRHFIIIFVLHRSDFVCRLEIFGVVNVPQVLRLLGFVLFIIYQLVQVEDLPVFAEHLEILLVVVTLLGSVPFLAALEAHLDSFLGNMKSLTRFRKIGILPVNITVVWDWFLGDLVCDLVGG